MNRFDQTIDRLTEGSIVKALLRLSLPIILANLLHTSYHLVNTFWVGRLGADAVAAIAVSFPIIFLLVSLGGGLAVAGSILIAQYAGARDTSMVGHVSAQTLLIVVVVSLLFSVVGYLATPLLLQLMGVEQEIFDEAAAYMEVSFLSIVFMFVFYLYQSIMRGVGQVKMPLYALAASVILNLILDPLFIFGWGPIPAGGVEGAAWATLLAEGVVAIFGLGMLISPRFGLQLRARDFAPDFALIKRLFLLGLPASIEQSAAALGITVMTVLVAHFGTLAIAAYGIGFRFLTFILIPAAGIAMAASTLVGQCVGAGKIRRAEEVAVLGSRTSFAILAGAGALLFIGAVPAVRFFVPDDAALIAEGAAVVRYMAISFGFTGIQMALGGALRGAGDTVAPMVLAITGVWALQIPLAWLLATQTPLGSNGLWLSYPLCGAAMAAATALRFRSGSWKHIQLTAEKRFQKAVTEEILIDEGRP